MAMPPKDFKGILKHYDISERKYDLWVAGHEASHAVVAIAVGGKVSGVFLNEETNTGHFSRARMQQDRNGVNPQALLAVAVAGPAYDALFATNQGIPDPLIIQAREAELANFLMVLNWPNNANAHALWERAGRKCMTIIATPDISAAIGLLQCEIYNGIVAGLTEIPSEQVHSLLAGKVPHFEPSSLIQ